MEMKIGDDDEKDNGEVVRGIKGGDRRGGGKSVMC